MTYFAQDGLIKTFRIVAQSDQSVSTNSTTNDDELFFKPDLEGNYFVEVFARFTCASATPDVRTGFTTGSGLRWMYAGDCADLDSSGLQQSLNPNSSSHLGFPQINLSGTSAEMYARLTGMVSVSTTEVTVNFIFNQDNLDGSNAVTREAGSYMFVRQVGIQT